MCLKEDSMPLIHKNIVKIYIYYIYIIYILYIYVYRNICIYITQITLHRFYTKELII